MSAFKYFLLRCWYYQALVLGLTAYRYDRCTHKLQRKLCYKRYRLTVNALVLGFLPFFYRNGLAYMIDYEAESLLYILGYVNLRLQCLMIFYVTCFSHHQDLCFGAIFEQFQLIEKQHFIDFQPGNRDRLIYTRFLYAKSIALCCHSFTFLFAVALISHRRHFNLWDVLLNVYFTCVWMRLHLIVFAYFAALLHISSRLHSLRAPLHRLADEQHVAGLLDLHTHLQQLALQLTELFGLHLVLLFIIMLPANSWGFYMAFVSPRMWAEHKVFLVFFIAFFAVRLVDILLLTCCCNMAYLRAQQLPQQLRACITKVEHETTLMYEQFYLLQAVSQFRINICGMFLVNTRTTFALLSYTLMQAIILIQIDFSFPRKKLI